MKLKTFDKINCSVITEYSVMDKKTGKCVDYFVVDYLAENKNIEKRQSLIEKGAEVTQVSASAIHSKRLQVTVVI